MEKLEGPSIIRLAVSTKRRTEVDKDARARPEQTPEIVCRNDRDTRDVTRRRKEAYFKFKEYEHEVRRKTYARNKSLDQ